MPNIITIGLIRGTQGRVRGREGNGMMEAEIKVVCLEDGVSGISQGTHRQLIKAEKDKETDFPQILQKKSALLTS